MLLHQLGDLIWELLTSDLLQGRLQQIQPDLWRTEQNMRATFRKHAAAKSHRTHRLDADTAVPVNIKQLDKLTTGHAHIWSS